MKVYKPYNILRIKNKKIKSREHDYYFTRDGKIFKNFKKNHPCGDIGCPWCIENRTRNEREKLLKKEFNQIKKELLL